MCCHLAQICMCYQRGAVRLLISDSGIYFFLPVVLTNLNAALITVGIMKSPFLRITAQYFSKNVKELCFTFQVSRRSHQTKCPLLKPP